MTEESDQNLRQVVDSVFKCIRNNEILKLKIFLTNTICPVDMNKEYNYYRKVATFLKYAISLQNFKIIEILLQNDANPDLLLPIFDILDWFKNFTHLSVVTPDGEVHYHPTCDIHGLKCEKCNKHKINGYPYGLYQHILKMIDGVKILIKYKFNPFLRCNGKTPRQTTIFPEIRDLLLPYEKEYLKNWVKDHQYIQILPQDLVHNLLINYLF